LGLSSPLLGLSSPLLVLSSPLLVLSSPLLGLGHFIGGLGGRSRVLRLRTLPALLACNLRLRPVQLLGGHLALLLELPSRRLERCGLGIRVRQRRLELDHPSLEVLVGTRGSAATCAHRCGPSFIEFALQTRHPGGHPVPLGLQRRHALDRLISSLGPFGGFRRRRHELQLLVSRDQPLRDLSLFLV